MLKALRKIGWKESKNSMAEWYNNYEVDFQEGFVRIELGEDDYEYLVSIEKFGSRRAAVMACRVFQIGFTSAREQTRHQLKDLIGI